MLTAALPFTKGREIPMPYTPTPEAKNIGLGHVFYEMQQFGEDCALWVSWGPFLNQQGINLVLEAMLIHVQALLDFFQKDTRGGRNQEYDDVFPVDFNLPRNDVTIDKNIQQRLHKDIAHISYSRNERVRPEQKAWQPEWFLPLVDRCLVFIEACQEKCERSEQYRASIRLDPRPWPLLKIQLAELQARLGLIKAFKMEAANRAGGGSPA
jgi:hypothetical protein